MPSGSITSRLQQDLERVQDGGIVVIGWMVDDKGYVLVTRDLLLVYWKEGREGVSQAWWDDIRLRHYRVYDGAVHMILSVGYGEDEEWDIVLDVSRGGLDALASLLGRLRR